MILTELVDARNAFLKDISKEHYATYLFNQHPPCNILELFAMAHDVADIRMAPAIYEDYRESWGDQQDQPPTLPIVQEYTKHLLMIKDDPDLIAAHAYVWHLSHLQGNETSGKLNTWAKDKDVLINAITKRWQDSMLDEAKIAIDYAMKLMTGIK